MGRPISKKFFGPDLGTDGFQITGVANFDGVAEGCYIIRQRSTHKFEVADAATGLKTMAASLTDMALAAAGPYFHILVNGSEHAKSIKSHRVSTFEGNGYVWSDLTAAATSATDSVTADLGDDEPDDGVAVDAPGYTPPP